MKNFLKHLIRTLISLVIIFLNFYFTLPALNPRSTEFWSFLIFSIVVFIVVNFFSEIIRLIKNHTKKTAIPFTAKDNFKSILKSFSLPVKILVAAIAAMILVVITGSVIGAEIFNAKRYHDLIEFKDADFVSDVAEIDRSQIPVVDRDTSERLGQRKLGEMSDLVSQFVIANDYTQINYKGRPTRVTPLSYGDPIKWFNNQKNGIPAYLTIDMTTQETSLIRLKEGIKYSNSEYFMRNLSRHLRFNYPTKIFDTVSFEIDDNGTPYWVASVVKYRIGIWSGKDIGGVVLVNAINGECEYFDIKDVPTWIDQAYDSDMILNQLNYNGKYRSGYFNSIFGQKGVLQATDGYNYLAINDDVWLYTGMTSVTSDESNVGFVLVNLRTKETRYYAVPGAEEYSAMESAEGQVQHLGYNSTFPLLLNISNRPTYFMSLKDSAGLVKMYAFVDVQQYQIVGTGNSIEAARKDYMNKLNQDDVASEDIKAQSVKGNVEAISPAVLNGNTTYFIKLSGSENIYSAPITLSQELAFLKAGDSVEIEFTQLDSTITVSKVTILPEKVL